MLTPREGFWHIPNEFGRARLPDKRLLRGIEVVMQALGMRPGDSFADAMGSEKALEEPDCVRLTRSGASRRRAAA